MTDKRCLCCIHWDRAYRSTVCDSCCDKTQWTPKHSCKSDAGALLCDSCKHTANAPHELPPTKMP